MNTDILAAVRAEFVKARTDPAPQLVLLVAVLMMIGLPLLTAFNLAEDFPVAGTTTVRDYLFSFPGRQGYLAALLLGVLIAARDVESGGTARLVVMCRGRGAVLVGKVVVTAVASLTAGLACIVAATLTVSAVVWARTSINPLQDPAIWWMGLRTLVVFVVWGLIGLGVGLLVRNTVASTAAVLLYGILVEPTITFLSNEHTWLSGVGRFLPSALSYALVWPSTPGVENTSVGAQSGQALAVGPAIGMLCVYAVLAVAVGYALGLFRRDLPA